MNFFNLNYFLSLMGEKLQLPKEEAEIFFDENLNFEMQRLGLEQKNLAELFGTNPSTVSFWSRGESFPKIPTLLKLCKFFGRTLDEMFYEDLRYNTSKGARASPSAAESPPGAEQQDLKEQLKAIEQRLQKLEAH